MPVFDFSGASDKKTGVQSECTYTTFQSNEKETSPEKPIMVLDNSSRQWKHHSCGIFTNPIKRTSFEFKEDDGVFSADIISIDSRFVSLLKWLGENHINVRLSGENKQVLCYTSMVLCTLNNTIYLYGIMIYWKRKVVRIKKQLNL